MIVKKISISLWRSLRSKILIILLIGLEVLFLIGYKDYRKISAVENEYYAQKIYGSYQVSYTTSDVSEKDRFLSQKIFDKAVVAIYDYSEDYSSNMVYCNEDLMSLTSYKLQKGKFPENENEILCESRYLIQNGFEYKDNQELTIAIDNTEFLVTGVFTINNVDEIYGIYTPSFIINNKFYKKKSGTYTVYCYMDCNDSYSNMADRLINECNIEKECIDYNWDVLSYLEIDEYGNEQNIFFEICDDLYLIILLLFSVLIVTVYSISCRNWKKIIDIYDKLGIRRGICIKSGLIVEYSSILSVSLVMLVIGYFVKSVITKDYSLIGYVGVIIYVLIYIFITFILLLLGNLNKYLIAYHKRKLKHKNIGKTVFVKNKFPFYQWVKSNHRIKIINSISMVIGIIISCTLVSMFIFILQLIAPDKGEYNYDYRVEYSYSDINQMTYGSEESANNYNELLKLDEKIDIIKIYELKKNVGIRRKDISDAYVDYLIKVDENAMFLLDSMKPTEYFEMPFVILGVDEEILENTYNLSKDKMKYLGDDGCILVSSVSFLAGGTIDIGVHTGDDIKINYQNKSIELNVNKKIDNIYFPTSLLKDYPVLIVNKNVFNELSLQKWDYPQMIYINKNTMDDATIKTFFKGKSGMVLTDLREEKRLYDNRMVVIYIAVYSMCGVLTVTMFAQIFLCMINKINDESRRIAVFYSIGIPWRHNVFSIIYEYLHLMVIAGISSIITSYIGNMLVFLYIEKQVKSFRYSIPVIQITLPVIVMIIIGIGLTVPMIIQIKKINADDLRRE